MRHQIENPCWKAVNLQRPYKLETICEILVHLASISPRGAVIFEVRSRNGQIGHLLCADRQYITQIEAAFTAHSSVAFREIPAKLRVPVIQARKISLSCPQLSLRTDTAASVIRAGLAAMVADRSGAETVLQITLGAASAPSSSTESPADPNASWLQVILGDVPKASAETRKSLKEKAGQHSFQTIIRIGTSGSSTASMQGVYNAIKTLESIGTRIYTEAEKPDNLNNIYVPWHFPGKLAVSELVNFLLFPAGDEELPGSPGLHPRLLLPPAWYRSPTNKQTDRSFALSMDAVGRKRLSISPRDSLEHTILLGPTGSGKSTAMQHLILADINAGRGVLVLDPKADLVNDILSRIPEERADDVVVLDPSDPAPVGFNPLAFKNYKNPTLIADTVLSVLREIFADCWGIYTQDLMSAALLTLIKIDGASLLWLPILFTDENFRKKIVSQVKDKVALQPFWQQFEALKDSEKRQQTAPVLNKMRQFLLRPGLRNVLGQANPKFSLTDLFYKRKIVLVPLNRGITGSESARLIGSLIVGLTWTLALSRASLPPEKRHIVSLYIDELQDYLSLPTDLSDALAQARGLGMSLTLAHQYRDQLPLDIRSGVDANARNKIIFGLSSKDAKDMAAMAPELEKEDFMSLPRYQIYTSFQSGGRNTGWVMGQTLPPKPAVRDPAELRAKSQKLYGIPAEQVEEVFLNLVNNNTINNEEVNKTPIGRRKIK